MLLLDPKTDQVLDVYVGVDNCDDEMLGFDIGTGNFENDMFGFELGSHILDEETRKKRS